MSDTSSPPTSRLPSEVEAILRLFPGPATIRASRWKMLALFSPPFILQAYAIVLFWPLFPRFQLQQWLVIGGILASPVLIPVLFIAISFIKDVPRVTFDAQGFSHTSLFSSWLAWCDFVSFRPFLGGVAFFEANEPKTLWARMNRSRFFPGFFQLKSKHMALLMEAWREKALQQTGPWARPLP